MVCRELVAMNKPGGVGLTIETILKATELASKHAALLHEVLNRVKLQPNVITLPAGI